MGTLLAICGLWGCGQSPPELKVEESKIATIDGPGLRIVNLNIAALRWDKTRIPGTSDRQTSQTAINNEFSTWLQRHHRRSLAKGTKTAFAFQEVSDHCAYFTSGDNLAIAQAALGGSYAGDMSSDGCAGGGSHGDAVMTNAQILRSESLNFHHSIRSCHPLSAHAMQVQLTPSLRPWIVSVHFDLLPRFSQQQLDATLSWVRSITGAEWYSAPIVIVGDFNLVSRGWDEHIGGSWGSVVCEGEPSEGYVNAQHHRDALAYVDRRTRSNGFYQVTGVKDDPSRASGPTFHAWSGKRRIDFAFVRNAPCEKCVFGHLTPPLGETPFYFADHTGIVVTVLPERQARQRVARHYLLVQ